MTRVQHRETSNNKDNGNRNICALAVANALGVGDSIRYLHTIADIIKAARTRYTVRSRYSHVKGLSVGGAREKLCKLSEDVRGCKGFIVRVDGHALLLSAAGKTVTDTAERKRDRRKMSHCYIVYDK